MPTSFQGHGLIDIFWDLFYPIVFVIFLWKFKKFLPKIGKDMNLWDLIKIILILLFLPNVYYAFFEAKHLFITSQLVDPLNNYSYLVFGSIAVFGLITTVYSVVTLINHYAKNTTQVLIGLAILCLANGFGATLGLLELYSWQAITNPFLFVEKIGEVFSTTKYLFIAIISSIFLYAMTYRCLYLTSNGESK